MPVCSGDTLVNSVSEVLSPWHPTRTIDAAATTPAPRAFMILLPILCLLRFFVEFILYFQVCEHRANILIVSDVQVDASLSVDPVPNPSHLRVIGYLEGTVPLFKQR